MAFFINVGLVFLVGLLKIKAFNLSGIWNSFKGLISVFPFLHLHTYWTRSPGFEFLYIIIGVCIPIGLILAGFVIQRSAGGNRLKNTSVFSVIYVILGFFIQLCSLNFNFKIWVVITNAAGSGINNTAISLIITIAYFWVFAFIFSFIGAFLAKKK